MDEVIDLNSLSIKELEALVGRSIVAVAQHNDGIICTFSGEGLSDVRVKITPPAAAFAALGGRVSTPKKAAAVRKNGMKGGRPKKQSAGAKQ